MDITPDLVQSIVEGVASWPVAAMVISIIFISPIRRVAERLSSFDSVRAKLGQVEVDLGQLASDGRKVVSNANEVNRILAESRLLELQITLDVHGPMFTEEHRRQLAHQIDELEKLLKSE